MHKIPKYMIVIAIISIAFVALSVHVAMMTVLNIPYPINYPKTGLPAYLKDLGIISATFFMYRSYHSQYQHDKPSIICHIGSIALLLLTLNESLIRKPLMDGISSSAWLYSFISNLSEILYYFVIALFVVMLYIYIKTLWKRAIIILFIPALIQTIILPFSHQITEFLLSFVSKPNPEDFILPPYGFNIIIPAYLTYTEVVISCFITTWLVWPSFYQRWKWPIALLTFLSVLLTGKFFAIFIYPFYSDLSPLMAILSVGQFSLESMVLGLLTAILVNHLYHHYSINKNISTN